MPEQETGVLDTTSLHNKKFRTARPAGAYTPGDAFMGGEVYQWPEFKAFANRLGIARELPTMDITITLPLDGLVRIAHDYQGKTRHIPPLPEEKT